MSDYEKKVPEFIDISATGLLGSESNYLGKLRIPSFNLSSILNMLG